MSSRTSLVDGRHAEILDFLSGNGRVKVSDLAERFGVSPLTMRRDLDFLGSKRLVRRTHGYAELVDPLGSPINSTAILAKRSIAEYAAGLIEDGDTVFINTSSTALLAIEHITAQNVTVVTNNGRALQLSSPASVSIILTGGEIRQPKWSMSGEFALASINRVNAAKAILGCSGLSAKRGLTTLVSHETSINSLMLEHSDMHIIVADGTKIGVSSSFRYGNPEQVDVLVTDGSADADEMGRLEAAGVREVRYATGEDVEA